MPYVFDQRAKSWINTSTPAVLVPEPVKAVMKDQESQAPATAPDPAETKIFEFRFLENLTTDQLVQGIVLAEILGPPACRRRGRSRR